MDFVLEGELVREVLRDQLMEADDNRRYLMCVIKQLQKNHREELESLEKAHQEEIATIMADKAPVIEHEAD